MEEESSIDSLSIKQHFPLVNSEDNKHTVPCAILALIAGASIVVRHRKDGHWYKICGGSQFLALSIYYAFLRGRKYKQQLILDAEALERFESLGYTMLGALTWYTFYRKRTHFMSDLYCLALCQWLLLRLSWDECFFAIKMCKGSLTSCSIDAC